MNTWKYPYVICFYQFVADMTIEVRYLFLSHLVKTAVLACLKILVTSLMIFIHTTDFRFGDGDQRYNDIDWQYIKKCLLQEICLLISGSLIYLLWRLEEYKCMITVIRFIFIFYFSFGGRISNAWISSEYGCLHFICLDFSLIDCPLAFGLFQLLTFVCEDDSMLCLYNVIFSLCISIFSFFAIFQSIFVIWFAFSKWSLTL